MARMHLLVKGSMGCWPGNLQEQPSAHDWQVLVDQYRSSQVPSAFKRTSSLKGPQ